MTGSDPYGTADGFRFSYDGPTLRYGVDAVDALGTDLDELGGDSPLLVCGSTVGSTPAVMDPVTTGLDPHDVEVFAETTPAKRLETALDARAAYRARDTDCLVGLGGGSSLDLAKVIRALVADDRDRSQIREEFRASGTITVPDDGLPPLVLVPTTLAGAEQSQVAGLTAAPEDPEASVHGGGVSSPRLRADTVCYDPALFATTPRSVLCGSAMNGFDKGIETLYARNASPVTDATAIEGLRYLDRALPALGDDPLSAETLAPVVTGIALVQYGNSRPNGSTLSIIHAFGHGLTAYGDLQQGVAHAVMAPHVLAYLFDTVDARRDRLATALDVGGDDPAAAIVDRVTAIRDALGLPERLRAVEAPDRDEFEAVAEAVLADSFMANAPPGVDPSTEDLVAVLEAAY